MTEINLQVVALVERELKRDRSLSSKDLQEKAVKIDKAIGKLTGRQFHAQYALQVRRRLSILKPAKSSGTGGGGDPARALLEDGLDEKRKALDRAIHEAFDRAVAAGDLGGVRRLLTALDRHTKEIEKV